MRDLVHYLKDDIVLDLSADDYGHPEGRAIVKRLHRNMKREDAELVCLKHGSPLYLNERPVSGDSSARAMWASHFDGTDCVRPAPPGMSDEHQRQTEYIARAADDAGFRTEIETVLPGSTVKPDAIIHGAVLTSIEVQRAALAAQRAVTRTQKAQAAGATAVWFNDRDPKTPPAWFFKVPSVGMNNLPWTEVHKPRSAEATSGVRVITADKCRFPNQCPVTLRAACGGFHPIHKPLVEVDRRLWVDDVAAQVPAGLLVPLKYQIRKRADVLLVDPESVRVYRELTGSGDASTTIPTTRPDRVPGRYECTADVGNTVVLDWLDRSHWTNSPGPCRWCGSATNTIDDDRVYAHKACAEDAIARSSAGGSV